MHKLKKTDVCIHSV